MESTLAVQLKDLQSKVGRFLGFGYGSDFGDVAWSTRQSNEINDYVYSGLRQFYTPPPLPGEKVGYEWSFLKPPGQVALAAGDATVALPDDLGGIEGDLALASSSSSSYFPVPILNAGFVQEKYALSPSTAGPPECGAVRPIKGNTLTGGSRFELYVYPTPDAVYTVSFTYHLIGDAPDVNRPYPYGGALHAETMIESCLAIAEQRGDDIAGLHTAKFFERLAASVSADRRIKPQKGGYNHDRSDVLSYGRGRRSEVTVTYNGQSF